MSFIINSFLTSSVKWRKANLLSQSRAVRQVSQELGDKLESLTSEDDEPNLIVMSSDSVNITKIQVSGMENHQSTSLNKQVASGIKEELKKAEIEVNREISSKKQPTNGSNEKLKE